MTAFTLHLEEIMILSAANGYLGSVPRLNRPGCEADDSPLSTADMCISGATLQDLQHEQSKFTFFSLFVISAC
jgi:hypothetical protein